MTRTRLLSAALAAALIPAAASAQSPAAAAISTAARSEERVLAYAVDWGPVNLAEIEFRVSQGPERTVVTGAGESLGLAALVADFKMQQRAVYSADGARRYETVSRFDGTAARREVSWPGDGPPVVERAESGRDEGPLTSIPSEEMVGTVDPAFPLIDAMARIEAGEGCGGTWRIFDGVRRMNVTLIDEGPDEVEADRNWTYGGAALRCRLKIERVGGFPVDRPPRAAEGEYDRLIWIAELPGGPAPVRMRVSWPLGYATGRIVLR